VGRLGFSRLRIGWIFKIVAAIKTSYHEVLYNSKLEQNTLSMPVIVCPLAAGSRLIIHLHL